MKKVNNERVCILHYCAVWQMYQAVYSTKIIFDSQKNKGLGTTKLVPQSWSVLVLSQRLELIETITAFISNHCKLTHILFLKTVQTKLTLLVYQRKSQHSKKYCFIWDLSTSQPLPPKVYCFWYIYPFGSNYLNEMKYLFGETCIACFHKSNFADYWCALAKVSPSVNIETSNINKHL